MKKLISIIFLLLFAVSVYSQTKEVPFTLADRDRIIKLEERLNSVDERIISLRNEMNTRFEAIDTKFEAIDTKFEAIDTKFEAMDTKFDLKFESQQQQLNDLKNLFYWGFGIMITLMIFMMGYMIWDRKTALDPIRDKTNALEKKTSNLVLALIEHSKTDRKLAEILKSFGIM